MLPSETQYITKGGLTVTSKKFASLSISDNSEPRNRRRTLETTDLKILSDDLIWLLEF